MVSVPVLFREPYKLALPIVRFPLLVEEPLDWLKLVTVSAPLFVNEPLDLFSVPIPYEPAETKTDPPT